MQDEQVATVTTSLNYIWENIHIPLCVPERTYIVKYCTKHF